MSRNRGVSAQKVLDVLPGFLTDSGSDRMTSGNSKITDLFGCFEVYVKAITMETVFTEDRHNPVFQLMAGWNMDPD